MRTIRPVLFLIFLSAVHVSNAQYLHASGKMMTDGKNDNVILRGVGLGGWMLQEGYMLRVQGIGQQQHAIRARMEELVGKEKTDFFYEAWLNNHMRKQDVDSTAKWGFNSIRLPMHYNLYTLPIEKEPVSGKNTWLERGFQMTDDLVKWCKANKMYLILDLHAAPGGQGGDLNISDRDPSLPSLWESEANQQKMIALWRKIAERYANEPTIGGYDIINEPNYGFERKEDKNGCGEKTNGPLKKLMTDITTAIREVDKNHMIIVEGNCWGNNYNGIFPLWDNNMAISFHKYWNYNDKASIRNFIDIREAQQAPVWLGESGENSNAWFRDAIKLVESNDIGWAWWPLKKLGANNPMEVKVPKEYQQILDFWSGKGEKPSVTDATKGLNELADNLKTENTIIHKDVVDAMFRQIHTTETRPFKKYTLPHDVIPAVDYDLGANGFAYHDLDTGNYYISTGKERTTGNRGGIYRNDGVDISKDALGNYVVDHIETGEWIQYTVYSGKSGTMTLKIKAAGESDAAKLQLIVNGKNPLEASVPNSTGRTESLEFKNVTLKKGANVIRVNALTGGFRLYEISAQ